MMKTLRKVFVFILFGGLIVAFAVSMGGNNSFDRYTHPTVAKVGSVEITPQQYQRAYQRSLENFSMRAGRPLTTQQAKRLGLPQRVLAGLIQDSAVDLGAKNLGLGLSEAGLRKAIMETEAFQDNGKFNSEKYQKFLQRVGYSEVGFEQEFKGDLVRRQVQNIFRSSGVVPAALLNAYNAFRNEERTVAYFTAGPDAAGTIEEPSSDTLQGFFDERKTQFVAPELRKVAVLAISPQALAKGVNVTEEEVKAEYDAKAASYNLPERRKLEIIPFQSKEAAEKAYSALTSGTSFGEVAKSAGINGSDLAIGPVSKKEFSEKFATNDAILNAVFSMKKDELGKPLAANYKVPERRKVEIIPFQSKEAAEKAYAELTSGTAFGDTAKRAGFSESDTALGTVSKKELGEKFAANEAILDTVFSLKKDEISKPIDGPLSWVIARVPEIVPAPVFWVIARVPEILPAQKSFEEVKDRVRDDLVKAKSAAEAAKSAGEASKLVKDFEEQRDSGLQLEDSAKKLGLPLVTVTLDARGNGEDGKPVALGSVQTPALAAAAFKSGIGVENEALRLPGNGYAWFEVTGIVPARQKPFDEVKAEVLEAWRKDQIRTRLGAKARELVEQLNKGTPVADVAKSVGAEVKTSKPLKRDGSEEGLPQQAVAQSFTLAEGGASSAASDAVSRVVFQTVKIAPAAALDEARTKTLEQELSAQIAEDNFAAYLIGVEKAAGVTIDQKTLAAAEGGSYDSSDGE
jgi:peptidyl-prolyl cis-trans isomerase D